MKKMVFCLVWLMGTIVMVSFAYASERHPNGWVYPMGRQPTSEEWNSWKSYAGHVGHDYSQSAGKPVKAVADGKVVDFSNSLSRYGSWAGARGSAVLLKHKTLEGVDAYMVYGHNRIKSGLKKGDTVKAGEVIAYTHEYYGKNGKRQDHIHMGIHPGTEPVIGINRFRGVCTDSDNCGWVDPKDFLNTHHPDNYLSSNSNNYINYFATWQMCGAKQCDVNNQVFSNGDIVGWYPKGNCMTAKYWFEIKKIDGHYKIGRNLTANDVCICR